jgi:hypothetical protein
MAAGGSPAGINRSAGLRLQGVEQRFRVGVVVADPWSGERPEYPQRLQPAFQSGRPQSLRGSLRLGACRTFPQAQSPSSPFLGGEFGELVSAGA